MRQKDRKRSNVLGWMDTHTKNVSILFLISNNHSMLEVSVIPMICWMEPCLLPLCAAHRAKGEIPWQRKGFRFKIAHILKMLRCTSYFMQLMVTKQQGIQVQNCSHSEDAPMHQLFYATYGNQAQNHNHTNPPVKGQTS